MIRTAGAQPHATLPHECVAGRLSRPVTPARKKTTNPPQNGSRVEDPCPPEAPVEHKSGSPEIREPPDMGAGQGRMTTGNWALTEGSSALAAVTMMRVGAVTFFADTTPLVTVAMELEQLTLQTRRLLVASAGVMA